MIENWVTCIESLINTGINASTIRLELACETPGITLYLIVSWKGSLGDYYGLAIILTPRRLLDISRPDFPYGSSISCPQLPSCSDNLLPIIDIVCQLVCVFYVDDHDPLKLLSSVKCLLTLSIPLSSLAKVMLESEWSCNIY
ncbi:hypothetical protein TNCV_2014161 [Trichonephila clavipes]|nr:hypothetical protein TNCV_2014161 [Trichonephila clavipes]